MDTAERAGSRWEIPISDPDQAYPALSSLGREVGKVSLRQLAGAANQSSKYLGLREACWCLDNDVPRWPGCGQRSAALRRCARLKSRCNQRPKQGRTQRPRSENYVTWGLHRFHAMPSRAGPSVD